MMLKKRLVIFPVCLAVLGLSFIMVSDHHEVVSPQMVTEFVPMTREEYLISKSAGNQLSYEEAEADLDSHIAAARVALPSLPHQDFNTVDDTSTSFGRIQKVYTHPSGFKMSYCVEAAKLCSCQGSNWIEVNEQSTQCQPEGNGNYQFIGIVTANIISNTRIRLAVTGYFEIAKPVTYSNKYNLYPFSYSVSTTKTMYYRENVDDVHIEEA